MSELSEQKQDASEINLNSERFAILDSIEYDVPPECVVCMENITEENWALYSDEAEAKTWKPSPVCKDCIKLMLDHEFEKFVKEVRETDCKATLRRLCEIGPPINLRDPKGAAFICDNEQKEVKHFYHSNSVQSAKLTGSFVGAQREELWEEIRQREAFTFS